MQSSCTCEALYEGLKLRQPGRFEVMSEDPLVIIDGAHNEAGAQALQETMAQHFAGKKILLVAGILADKEIDSIVKFLTKITDHIIVTEPDNPRKLAAEKLAEHVADFARCGGCRFGCRGGSASCKGAGGRLRRDPVCGIAVFDRRCTEVMEK